jgi:predicted O-methyltransferase YrrM
MGQMLRKIVRTIALPFNRRRAFKRLKEYHAEPRTLEQTIDFALNFGGHGHFKVKTLQIPQEILSLASAVEAIKPKIILEIGTARGGTLLIWSRLASERVISCDLEDMKVQSGLFQGFPPPGSRCRVTLLSGDSHDPDFRRRVAGELGGRKADFLFIDGDHTEAGVTADYENYRGFVRPGGIIAFHDIVQKQLLPSNQVCHFWKRVKKEALAEEFISDPNQTGFGIGIIRVPEQ